MAPVTLPRLGLGMAALGRPGYINLNRDSVFGADRDGRSLEKMQTHANLVLDALFRLCATTSSTPWMDCARSYGMSEKFVGDYLRKHDVSPEDVYVSSKWGYAYTAGWKVNLDAGEPHEVKDLSIAVSGFAEDEYIDEHSKIWIS